MQGDYFDWQAAYSSYHSRYPSHERRPLIGITGNFGDKGCELAEGYYESVLRAGGVPVVLPPFEDRDALAGVLDAVDGLLLSGGGDMNPLFVGEEPERGLHQVNYKRDLCELLLIRLAYDRQIPMLGICRGIQMLAVALGGTIWQDINSQVCGRLIGHDQQLDRRYASHTVCISNGSTILGRIFDEDILSVNSLHHQAVRAAGKKLRVCAFSPDGLIEAVESAEYKPILGVQWHPECFILRGDTSMMPLFRWFCGEASLFRQAKALHEKILTLDSHCDTPMLFGTDFKFNHRDARALVDLHKMSEGHLDAVVMAAYLKQGARTESALRAATEKADCILSEIEAMTEENKAHVGLARTADDLYRLKKEGKKAVMMGIENGYAIGRDLTRLEHFRRRGVVYVTLCHNGDNDICDSARGGSEHGGLSDFGAKVVAEMNRVGLIIDLSHASERTFWDVLAKSKQPVVCSHSSSRALCDVPRNLSDEQLRALAQKGGVAQVTLYKGFLRTAGEATICDAVAHLCRMADVAGVEHVGFGSDFDGDGGVVGCASAAEVINFTKMLLAKRFSAADIEGIWGGNFIRVMKKVQNV